jgi:hypothetical protein
MIAWDTRDQEETQGAPTWVYNGGAEERGREWSENEESGFERGLKKEKGTALAAPFYFYFQVP